MIGVKKKEDIFFDLFVEAIEKIGEIGTAFEDLMRNYTDVEQKVAKMKELETECDHESHKILQVLNASFITPFDREDIFSIAKDIDDIADVLEDFANRLLVYNVKCLREEAVVMMELIMQEIKELKVLFRELKNMKKGKAIIARQIIEVNRLENEGDIIYREALTKLFAEEKDPIEIIKWQQLFKFLEDGMDACENVANGVEGVVMKHA